jgi:hypothetical protein
MINYGLLYCVNITSYIHITCYILPVQTLRMMHWTLHENMFLTVHIIYIEYILYTKLYVMFYIEYIALYFIHTYIYILSKFY